MYVYTFARIGWSDDAVLPTPEPPISSNPH
jgi:hypothetical protein